MRVSYAPYAAAVAILSLLTGSWPASASAASPEIRGTWITTTSSDDWTSSNLPGTMSSLKQVGLNTVYVEAWKNGYTNYNSTTLSTFTGTTSLNPSLGSRVLLNETRTAAANAGLVHGAWFEYGAMAQFLGNTGPRRAVSTRWLGSAEMPPGRWAPPAAPAGCSRTRRVTTRLQVTASCG